MKYPWRKTDWVYYEFRRARWPEGITSWTYSRMAHPIMWMIFGNDQDGCTPSVHGKQFSWFGWWARNEMANFKHCVIGLALWKEGLVGDDAFPIPELERKFWIGQDAESKFIVSGVRKVGFKIWRPYIRIPLPFGLAAWWGWKPTRGNLCCAVKKSGV